MITAGMFSNQNIELAEPPSCTLQDEFIRGPLIVYIYKQAEVTNRTMHIKPIILPLMNITSSVKLKMWPVFRKVKELTEEEKQELCKELNPDCVDVGADDIIETFKSIDSEEEFKVLRMIPVTLIKGNVKVKKSDSEGNIIMEVHEARFEYAEESQRNLSADIRNLIKDLVVENKTQIKSMDNENNELNSDDDIGILWESSVVSKLDCEKYICKIELNQLEMKKRKQQNSKCKKARIGNYMACLHSLRNKTANMFAEELFVFGEKDEEFRKEPDNSVKLFFKDIMQYKDAKDKFKTAYDIKIQTINSEQKCCEVAEREKNDLFKELMEKEEKLLDIIQMTEWKELINKSLINKRLAYKELKKVNRNYFNQDYIVTKALINHQEFMDQFESRYHDLVHRKKELEASLNKSIALLTNLKKKVKVALMT